VYKTLSRKWQKDEQGSFLAVQGSAKPSFMVPSLLGPDPTVASKIKSKIPVRDPENALNPSPILTFSSQDTLYSYRLTAVMLLYIDQLLAAHTPKFSPSL
jgi:hypothetical protein